MWTRPSLGVLFSLLLIPSGAGAMTVTSASTAPAAVALLARDVVGAVGSYTCDRGVGTSSEIGQTFRLAQAATLDRITLRVVPQTDVGGALVILHLGTFSDATDVTMDELLFAEIAPLPNPLATGSAVYLTFELTGQQLAAGQQYGFALAFSGGDHVGEARLDVDHVGADSYADGHAFEWSGLQETSLANDLVFYLQGAPEGTEQLVLLGGRFVVEADWATAEGSGVGWAVKLTEDSGYFWFFASSNVEALVKLHDACVDPWQRYWVFAAGLTNVGVSLRVSDVVAGVEHTYVNEQGQPFQPIQDTATFATCGQR